MKTMRTPGFTGEASLCETTNLHWPANAPDNSVANRGVQPQLSQDNYTTRDVCKACGCTPTDVACDCGTPPNRRKLDCINNGGPTRTAPMFSSARFGGGVFRAR